jgi:hypothetical protein
VKAHHGKARRRNVRTRSSRSYCGSTRTNTVSTRRPRWTTNGYGPPTEFGPNTSGIHPSAGGRLPWPLQKWGR